MMSGRNEKAAPEVSAAEQASQDREYKRKHRSLRAAQRIKPEEKK
jgi:hypothetical protein